MDFPANYKFLIITCLLGSAWVFLSVIDFATLALHFIAVGEVPGTDISLTSNDMYAVLLVTLLLNTPWIMPEFYKSVLHRAKTLLTSSAKSSPHQTKA